MTATILIADDSRVSQHMLKLILKRNGYEPIVTSNGQQALEQTNERAIDLIISDIEMPEMNGFERLAKVRASSNTPVIMLTATGDEDNQTRSIELGANGFISQPFNSDELLALVQELIAQRAD